MIAGMRRLGKVALAIVTLLGVIEIEAIEIRVVDREGNPIPDVVVYGEGTARPGRAVMDQENRRFVPEVLAVSVGTVVEFPNSDQISHHVYSFSPAKRFELPLYRGTTAEPVEFGVPGVVTLGCNIHDTMVGYIVVVDSNLFAVTDENGEALLDLPESGGELRLWHPNMAEEDFSTQSVGAGRDRVTVELDLTVEQRDEPSRLEDRFKRFRNGS